VGRAGAVAGSPQPPWQVLCQWHPAGPEARLHAFAFEIEGHKRRLYPVTSELGLSAQQVVELCAARFTQEDAHRDRKQHLGLGVSPGRLKTVVPRTFQLRPAAMALLRIPGERLDLAEGDAWWAKPPWYRHEQRGPFTAIKRLFAQARVHLFAARLAKPDLRKTHDNCRHRANEPALRSLKPANYRL